MILICDNKQCGKKFERKKSMVPSNKLHFCCRKCYFTYRKTNKSKYNSDALNKLKGWAKIYESRN